MSKKTSFYLVPFFLCTFLFSLQSFAQNWQTSSGGRFYVNPTNTSVGVGTAYPYISYRMTVVGGGTKGGIYASGNPYAGNFAGHVAVSGDLKANEYTGTFSIFGTSADSNGPYFRMYGPYHSSRPGGMTIASYQQGTIEFSSRTSSGWSHHMTIHPTSKVSIGTQDTPNVIGGANISSYHLFVDGGILTDELRVRTDWADYVFGAAYQLKSLKEVQAHIEEKGYLHNTPSAAQVEAEGIAVGEMTKNQQEKIEEIFLHLIALEKRIDQLESENQTLRQALNEE
ncbi:MAG: hypothetical protein AAF985_18495 [Bacteroidota bacterium]